MKNDGQELELFGNTLKEVIREMNSTIELSTTEVSGQEHVLIVDDENGPRQALRMLLKEDLTVHMAESVPEALELVSEKPITLVITDLRMPNFSGVDLLCKVKEKHPDIQVIILTGYGQLDSAMKAVEYGAFAYMEKPFDNVDMVQHVKAGIEKYRSEHERRVLEDLALEANRFETLGRIVGGMVHDLGTPLSVLNGEIELMQYRKEVTDLPERLDAMHTQVHHCTDMVRTTMNLLRNESDGPSQFALNMVVESCLSVCESSLRSNKVTTEKDFSSNLSCCSGDAVLVRQAILNLINNAVYAMSKQDTERHIILKTWRDDDFICLSVSDSGPGIPESYREHVFKTFFTTKGKDGSGLGLAVVRNVMRRLCGNASLSENEKGGATFTLKFPAFVQN